MKAISSRILALSMLLFVLILVCAACSNEQDALKAEAGPASVTQDALITDAIDHAKPTQAVKEIPASEEADQEQPVTQGIGTVEATPVLKPTVTESAVKEPAIKVTSEQVTDAPAPSTITISITGDEKKGVILEPTSIQWEDGDSVLDVLKQVTKNNKITLEYKGVGMLSYVEGIANLYEFDQGTNSGWLFKINGDYATRSAGAVKLSIGDNVEWIYSIKKDEELEE